MNFADEEYVRLYIRDTDTWRALGFEGQAVLALMLRRFDNSGVYKFGKRTPVRSIMAALGCTEEFASKGLEAILAEDVWEQGPDRFFWPTHDEAQHCKRSDKIRKREERARKAALAAKLKLQSCHADVTSNVANVTTVTNCPVKRTHVTPGEGEARQGSDLERGTGGNQATDPVADRSNPNPSPGVRMARSFAGADPAGLELFQAWKNATGLSGASYDPRRRDLFERLVFEGVTVADVEQIVAGAKTDHWAREEQKLAAHSILGSADQREKYMARAKNPPRPKPTDRDAAALPEHRNPMLQQALKDALPPGVGAGKAHSHGT